MSLLLRCSLAILFAGLAAIIFTQPIETEKYIRVRYGGLRYFVSNNFPSLSLPRDLFSSLPRSFFMFVSGALALGAMAILLHRKLLILLYAYLTLVLGGLMHIPYDNSALVPQLRKLIFVFAVFFCMLTLAATDSEKPAEKLEKATEKTE